jgi:hypothetical protein
MAPYVDTIGEDESYKLSPDFGMSFDVLGSGSTCWQTSWPVIVSSKTNPADLAGKSFIINGTTINLSGSTMQAIAHSANTAIPTGVGAAVWNGKLAFFADQTVAGGVLIITSAANETCQVAMSYKDHKGYKNIEKLYQTAIEEFEYRRDKINHMIEHPSAFKSAAANQNVVIPVYLTKDEKKKQRRRKRLEKQKEMQEKIKLGLVEPPPPKVKFSNFLKNGWNVSIKKQKKFCLRHVLPHLEAVSAGKGVNSKVISETKNFMRGKFPFQTNFNGNCIY